MTFSPLDSLRAHWIRRRRHRARVHCDTARCEKSNRTLLEHFVSDLEDFRNDLEDFGNDLEDFRNDLEEFESDLEDLERCL